MELPADIIHEIMLRVPLEYMVNVYLAIHPMHSIEYYQRKLLRTKTMPANGRVMYILYEKCARWKINTKPLITITYFPKSFGKYHKKYDIYGIIHNYDDKPAIFSEQVQYSIWKRYGEKHRDDGPAVVIGNDCLRYYKCNIRYDGIKFRYVPSTSKCKLIYKRIMNLLDIFPEASSCFIHKQLKTYVPCISIHFVRKFMTSIRKTN